MLLFRNGESCEGRKVAVYRIPALASWPDGSLVAVTDARYDDYRDLSDGHPICIACRRSSDGGKSWSEPTVLWRCPWNDTEKWAASDPSLIVDERTGRAFCFCNVMEHVRNEGLLYRHFVQSSDDKGVTWGSPVEISAAIRPQRWNPKSASLITSGRGVQLRDGTLIHTMTCDDEICLFGSEDHGATWKAIGNAARGGSECKVVELDDGEFVVSARVEGRKGGRLIHVSRDRGKTWASRLDMTIPDSGCNAGLNVLPVNGRNMMAFSNCASWGERNSVTLRLSGDGGKSWTQGILIDLDDGGYSEVVKLPGGAAGVIWERIKTGLTYFRRIEAAELCRDAATAYVDPYAEGWIPCCTQRLVVAFSSAEAASRASAEIAPLPFGKKYAFSTRWDDMNPRHEQMAATLNPLGVYSTFYINGRPDDSFCSLMRRLVAAGNSIGCHSISHVRMEHLLPAISFREVMENRIALEIGSQSPVSTFVLPYSNAAAVADEFAENRVGMAVANAGLIGGAETRRDIAGRYGFPNFRWCASYTFRANDREPSAKEFDSRFGWGLGLCDRNALFCGPHMTFGVHTWQSDAGLKTLGDFVGKVSGRDDIWYVNENTYAACRIQSLNAKVVKKRVKGDKVLFEIVRPMPYALGAAVDLHLTLSETPKEMKLDGKPMTANVQVCLPPSDVVPTRFVRLGNVLKVANDLETFHAEFVNEGDSRLSDVRFFLRLPPGYEPGVLQSSRASVAPGERVSLRWKATAPKGLSFREGNFFAALEVDGRNAEGRVRYWTTLLKSRALKSLPVPRDAASVCGPLKRGDVLDAAILARVSVPGTQLPDVDGARFGKWRRAAAWTSAMEYAVVVPSPDEGQRVRDEMRTEKDANVLLLAFDFNADVEKGGRLWRMAFKALEADERKVAIFLNGKPFAMGAAGLFEPQPGANRVVFAVENRSAAPFLQELSIKSVPDGIPATFFPAVR